MHSFRLVLEDRVLRVRLTALVLISVFVCLIPQAEIFQEYIIKEDTVGFQVNLTVLLDCLTIFGGSTVPGVYHNDNPVLLLEN